MDRLIEIIKKEFSLRVIEENLSRVQICLDHLTDDQLWHRPNDNSNSIGNLMMHLEGNIRQYILSGVGEEKDARKRKTEFDPQNRKSREELYDNLHKTCHSSNAVVQKLSAEKFSESVTIQGFEHTRLSAMLHVIEHFSYHVGQITYYTKATNNIDTAYYGNMDLEATG